MFQLAGTYELASQENYKAYLVSFGFPEDKAEKLSRMKGNIIISDIGADSVTIAYGDKKFILPINKESEHVLWEDKKVQSVLTVQDDGLTLNSKLVADESLTEKRVFKITDSGLTTTSTNSKGVTTIRKYTRA